MSILMLRRPAVAGPITFGTPSNPLGAPFVKWGKATGTLWGNARATGGIACGEENNSDNYRDSTALLSGYTANQEIEAVVALASGAVAGSTLGHEVELLLRADYADGVQNMVECLWGYASGSPYFQIMRHAGGYNSFSEIGTADSATPTPVNGSVFRVRVIGTLVQAYVDNVLIAHATTDFATGQPGVGFFWRGTENITDYGFSSVIARSLS